MIIFFPPEFSQATDPAIKAAEAVFVTFEPTATFTGAGAPSTVNVVVPHPQLDGRQELVVWTSGGAGIRRREVTDASGLNGADAFDFTLRGSLAVEIGYKAVLLLRQVPSKPDLDVERKLWTLAPDERTRLAPFLRSTPSLGEGDPLLAAAGAALSPKLESPVVVARRIYDAVLDRLRYERRNEFKGAARAFAERTGECSDFSALFVAWCRQAGIPARAVAGYRLIDKTWDMHVWAEFYVRGAGWQPCDPANAANGVEERRRRTFCSLPATYLALTRDVDLDYGQVDKQSTRLLQSYFYRYTGASPAHHFAVKGGLLEKPPVNPPATLPAWARPKPPPRGRRAS